MTWLQFIASVIGSVVTSWPLAILGAVVYVSVRFRQPLSRLISSIEKLIVSKGSLEVQFHQELGSIGEGLREPRLPEPAPELTEPPTNPSLTAGPNPPVGFYERMAALAAINPLAAVRMAWIDVSRAITIAAAPLIHDGDTYYLPPLDSPTRDIRILHDGGYIDDETYNSLLRLANLSNTVLYSVHEASKLTNSDALEYAELAQRVIRILQAVDVQKKQ